jgi:hypothetical protein
MDFVHDQLATGRKLRVLTSLIERLTLEAGKATNHAEPFGLFFRSRVNSTPF